MDLRPAPPPEKQVAGLPNTTRPSTWGASVLKIGGTWHMWHTEIAN
eukprot:gene6779-1136_t